MEEEKPSKYSLVTGEKIKTKTVGMIKKQHREKNKREGKEAKKLESKINKVDKKLKVEKTDAAVEASSEKTGQTKVLIVRKQEQSEPKSPGRKFLNLLSYVLVGFVAVVFGYFAGNFYISNVLNKVDYSAFNEAELVADKYAVYTSVKNRISSGRPITMLNSSELFVAAEYVLSQMDSYYAEADGLISPDIARDQQIFGFKSRVGGKSIIENVSNGLIAVGERIEYDSETGETLVYKAKKGSISNTSVQFDTNSTKYTIADFKAEYGFEPNNPVIPYIVNPAKTVISGSDEKATLSGVNLYQVRFSLTPDTSVINYIKQVKHMSGLGDYPTFKSIVVTALIEYDSSDVGHEFKFSQIRYDEAYSITYVGVIANCTGYLTHKFSY